MVTNRPRCGRHQTLILAIAGLLVMGVALAACSVPAEPELCRDTAADYLAAADALNKRWADAVTLAGSTPRIALGPVVADMQAIQRETAALTVPECVGNLNELLMQSMDPITTGVLLFMQGADSEYLEIAVELAAIYAHDFNVGYDAVMTGFDRVTPTP